MKFTLTFIELNPGGLNYKTTVVHECQNNIVSSQLRICKLFDFWADAAFDLLLKRSMNRLYLNHLRYYPHNLLFDLYVAADNPTSSFIFLFCIDKNI